MAHFLFNFSEPDPAQVPAKFEQAAARLRVKMWAVDADEPHRDSLAPGDLILIYLGEPERAFVGRAQLASAVREWTSSEAQAYPGESPSGVFLSGVEGWDPPVPMADVLPRVDPAGTNPQVQANAKDGFQTGVVRITTGEYESVLAVRKERLAPGVSRQ